LFGA
jgi:amino acid transporter